MSFETLRRGRGVDLRAGFLAGCCAAAMLTGPAMAQDAPAEPAGEVQLEEIIVTGTRLGTSTLNAQTPLQIITAEQFEIRGETSAADALEQVPALQFSLNTEQTLRDEVDGVTGRATLNLRSLGAARTLVLVNGRRHVAGAPGTASVDVSTIPSAMIERVDVLTGGASAIYGSDAVTGVVNFVLKDDFEGHQFDIQLESSDNGDALKGFFSYVGGVNFDNGRGNVTFGAQYEDREGLRNFDRAFSDNNGVPLRAGNPALRFQDGDPLPPGVSRDRALGRTILRGSTPRFPGTAQALIDRANAAAPFAIERDFRFAISSVGGLFGFDPNGFLFADGPDFEALLDINGNGIQDCRDSAIGSGVAGFVAGCWVIDTVTGAVRPFRDGVVADGIRQFGGDGAEQATDADSLTPETQNFSANINAHYDIAPLFNPYVELKFSRNRAREYSFYNTFDDTLTVGLDNPFIPAALRSLANQEIAARLAADPTYDPSAFLITIARDHTDIFDPVVENERRTYRGVIGTDGEFENGWRYDLSYNYGRTEEEVSAADRLRDRFFAAADATVDAAGNPACRISVDGTLPIASFLDPEAFSPVAPISYQPSDCVPLNLFGIGNNTPEALAFQRSIGTSNAVIEQSVFQAVLTGDSGGLFTLPAGDIEFALGGEYRDENSEFTPSETDQNGNAFEKRTVAAVSGSFDVLEGFAEVSVPLLADLPFANLVNVNGAVRIGDYSTIGSVTSWKVDAIYSPIEDIRFRGGYSQTIRAPNITELFLPGESVNSNPTDVCLQELINLGPSPADRLRNCSAQFGRDLAANPHTNQRTAQFAGLRGGNPDLQEETSDTYSVGVVLTPTFLPGFSATVDYWNITIEDAIQAVSQNDIVSSCYDAPDLNNPFCGLFTRDLTGTPATNPQFGWINSIRQADINFAGLEASGIDFDVIYSLDLADFGQDALGGLTFRVGGTWIEKRNDFPFPSDPDRANPELYEFDRPKWAGAGSIVWDVDKWSVGWFVTYQGRQTLRLVEIELLEETFPNFAGDSFIHDVSVTYDVNDKLRLIGGVNDVFQRDPYFTETSSPGSAVGRSIFFRISAKL